MTDDVRKQTGGYIGQSVPRREDRNLLLGKGEFVADIQLPNMVHVAFARSPLPHATINDVDAEAARAVDGVCFVASGADVCAELPPINGMQVVTPQGWRDRVDTDILIPDQPLVPEDKVRYVGEAFALAVADSRYIAEDALELIEAELVPLPPLAEAETALADGAGLIHEHLGRNVAAFLHTKKGDGAAAMDACPNRLSRRFVHHRYAAMPMETRGVVAEYDRRTDTLTVWSSTQIVHWVRREVSTALDMPEERIRCIAPDVGGGFGGKGHVYPEDILVAWLAKKLDRPVKWVEDRHEHILNAAHSRDNIYDVEIGFDDDGRILAVTSSFLVDSGAYTPVGAGIAGNSIAHMLGPYDIPHYETDCKVVLTNRTPNAPYRGAGRPEVGFAMERAVDLVANHLDLDPAKVRFLNMIPADAMPYEVGLTYRDGVPMGGDLAEPTSDAPTFMVQAMKDPDAANLDQAQIIKGWIDGEGQTHEQIYYVALSDDRSVDPETGLPEPVGSTVDLENVSFSNTIGAVQLSAQWTDPDFNSDHAAFYYARVIEIPRPRWSEYDRKAFNREFSEAPRTVQDRAYSSPIWYRP